jgi:hypothetical protein
MGYSWDFTKLPNDKHETVIDRYQSGDALSLMLIHNEYELSPTLYCCAVQNSMVMAWFKHGIENGYIRKTNS